MRVARDGSALVLLIGILAGCATTPPPTAPVSATTTPAVDLSTTDSRFAPYFAVIQSQIRSNVPGSLVAAPVEFLCALGSSSG